MAADLPDVPGLASHPAAVRRRLVDVSAELGLSADHLAATIAHESAWQPAAVNPHSGAVGLIQFLPSTARALGSSAEAIRAMGALEQLDLVAEYFRRIGRPVGADVAMAVFLPRYVGAPDETVLFRRGSKGYEQNAPLDHDGDGAIQAGELRARIERLLAAAAARPRLAVEDESTAPTDPAPPPTVRDAAWGALWLLFPLVGLALAVRR